MKTTIRTYRFDVNKPADKAAYDALCATMAARGSKCFETHGGGSHYQPSWDGREVELETAFVFENQWNTAPVDGITDKGLRVFDWAQDYRMTGKWLKQGHYLEMTPEMIEVRENRMKCGYCGTQYDKRENPPAFCSACLGSQHLKVSDLKLTRIEPVTAQKFAPLTDSELAELLPVYQAEQAGKGSERARKARADYGARLQSDFDKAIAKATTKHNGLKWLYDRGCSLRLMDNCIYYDHTGVFTFGWRDKLQNDTDLDWLTENLSEFPFKYEIDTVHRGKISGAVAA